MLTEHNGVGVTFTGYVATLRSPTKLLSENRGPFNLRLEGGATLREAKSFWVKGAEEAPRATYHGIAQGRDDHGHPVEVAYSISR